MSGLHDSVALGTARAHVRANLDGGAPCPCCGQMAKRYRRTLNAPMCRALIALHRCGPGWHHVNRLPIIQGRHGGGDFAKLRWWGLIDERAKGEDDTRRTSGLWRVTSLGQRFVYHGAMVPRYAFSFDGDVELGGEHVSIGTALGSRWSWRELMAE